MGTLKIGDRVEYKQGGSIPDFEGQCGYISRWYNNDKNGPHVMVRWDNPRIFDGVYAFHKANLKVIQEKISWEL